MLRLLRGEIISERLIVFLVVVLQRDETGGRCTPVVEAMNGCVEIKPDR